MFLSANAGEGHLVGCILMTSLIFFSFLALYQILSRADNNTVMDAVDSEVSVTCTDLNLVRKAFQLALLCTKMNPSERPSMHEVARVLVSLLPIPPAKPCSTPTKANYTRYVMDSVGKQQRDHSSSDAQWFVKFGEVISKNTL